MPIYYVENYFSGYGHESTYVLPANPVSESTSCWATVCETTAAEQPMFGDARLTVLQCGPYSDGAVGVRVGIGHQPSGQNINYRVRAFFTDFGENTPTFSVLGPVSKGRGGDYTNVTFNDPAFAGRGLLWASVCEYDPTGQNPLFGDAYLTVQQIVPDPDNSNVQVGVWIDNVPQEITYRVTVFGVS
jgi:hypothetical protein